MKLIKDQNDVFKALLKQNKIKFEDDTHIEQTFITSGSEHPHQLCENW